MGGEKANLKLSSERYHDSNRFTGKRGEKGAVNVLRSCLISPQSTEGRNDTSTFPLCRDDSTLCFPLPLIPREGYQHTSLLCCQAASRAPALG